MMNHVFTASHEIEKLTVEATETQPPSEEIPSETIGTTFQEEILC